jgi:hypothetical protein
MRFFQIVDLHGVAIQVSGTYQPAEKATRDYPGCKAEVYPTTTTVGGVDVSNWLDTFDLHQDLEAAILTAISL